MKRIFRFAALAAALAGMFLSCSKENGKGYRPGGDDDDEEEQTAAITLTIDGDFSDWDALPETVNVTTVTTDAKASRTALTGAKFCMDENFVYVYFIYDETQITDKSWVPFHVYLDADNSDATGGYGDEFEDADTEFLLETAVFSGGEFISWDPALFKWWGEVGGTGWVWSDPNTEHSSDDLWGAVLGEGSGIASGAGKGNAYELRIIKEMCAGVTFADTIGIGIDIQQNWTSVGVLPNTAVSDSNVNGLAPKAKVAITK